MRVCSPVIQLLAASPFFPHEEQERGVTAALHTHTLAPAWDTPAQTQLGRRQRRGAPHPAPARPCLAAVLPRAECKTEVW